MPRVRCAPCSWGPHGAATAVSETLPSRTSASCIPSPADRGMVRALQPGQGAALWLLSLLNRSHAGTALCASLNGKGHLQVLPTSWAEAAWLEGQSRGLAGLQQGTGDSRGCSGWRGTGSGFLRGWWKRLVLCWSWSWRMASAGVPVCVKGHQGHSLPGKL